MKRLGWERTVWAALTFAVSGLGCTTMTPPTLPDASFRRDAQVDAGPDVWLPTPVIDTCTPEGMDATLGESCAADSTCDDGCFCNGIERCEAGTCVAGADPCVDEVDCTVDACLEEANRCFHEPRHVMCSNGDACDGLELCDLIAGCITGVPPYCNDDDSCTVDSCDTATGCVHVLRDLDGDGFIDGRCGGEDCDDDPRFGRDIYPGAVEDCTNRRDDDCDGLRDYNDPDCRPTNDTCETAVFLPGPGTYSGSNAGLSASYTLSCRASGPDAVFRFTLDEPQDVQVTVSGGGTGAAVALRPWAQCGTGPDEKCNQGSPPSFLRRSLPAGEYAILVQSSGSGAPFDLNLRFSPPTPIPPIDVCDEGTLDLCDGAPCGTVVGHVVTGMFAETEDDYRLSCRTASGSRRDAAYRFTIDAPKDVTFTASTGSSTNTYLALTTDCGATSAELGCHASAWSSPAEIRRRELPPGTYYVLIESENASSAAWSLTATITDPVPRNPGDACSVPLDISEPVLGGGASASVDASLLDLDSGNACGGRTSGFRDASFVFTLPTMRDVTLTTVGGSGTYYTALQRTCGVSSTDLRCWSGSGTVGQSWRSLPAGTYYVTLSTAASTGSISATLRTSDPTPIPPNDRCDGAVALTSGTSRRDTTIAFEDDSRGGTCAGPSYPDAFYEITLTERRRLLLSVSDADGGSDTFYLTLRDVCGGSTTAAILCQSGSPATINHTLEPGTYWIMVETLPTRTSDYTLDAFLLAP